MTYTKGKCLVYDRATLAVVNDFAYQGEGWGICNDGEYLYNTNGSNRIYVRNPETFEVVRTMDVMDNVNVLGKLNELEYVDGLIYAHVWMTDAIVVIEPNFGKVVAMINAEELTKKGRNGGDVQNGIAYNPESKTFFITGKYWDTMFEVNITPPKIVSN